MIQFIDFLIEANIALLVFLGVYRMLLARETNFIAMRIFLLSGIMFSMLLPFVEFTSSENNIIPDIILPAVIINAVAEKQIESSTVIWKLIEFTWAGGVCISAIRLILEFISLSRLLISSIHYKKENFSIFETAKDHPTFSFFNNIYLGKSNSLSAVEKQQIIQHEMIHAKHFHSLDIILIRLIRIVFWFNPLLKYYQKHLVQLHEFEADARAVENSDADKYCSLLAKVALQSADYPIANYFNNSLTLKRINMIRTIKRKISQWRLAVAAAAFPIALFVFGFHQTGIAQEVKPSVPASSSDEVHQTVDELPRYKQGNNDLFAFLMQNMKYPKQAREKKIEGTVYTEFVVEKNGEVSEVKVIKGIGNGCDDEAIRVVKSMSKWNPGILQGKAVRTKMVLPLVFKLS
jgi:TonB family protein